MNQTLLQATKTISALVAIIMIIITSILILIRLFGNSPSETTIFFSGLAILVSFQILIISILLQMKEDIGSLKEFRNQTIHKIQELDRKIKK